MKKKIAGVLTTVLAASLFVSGNAPVTGQQDNMTAQSQDNKFRMPEWNKDKENIKNIHYGQGNNHNY